VYSQSLLGSTDSASLSRFLSGSSPETSTLEGVVESESAGTEDDHMSQLPRCVRRSPELQDEISRNYQGSDGA
jgi:hypothetical protein